MTTSSRNYARPSTVLAETRPATSCADTRPATERAETRRAVLWRYSPRDGVLVALAASYAAALLGVAAAVAAGHVTDVAALGAAALVAGGLWWGANTIAHNFLHRPFFAAPLANRLFSLCLSVLLGFPQRAWRDLHLAHHAGKCASVRGSAALCIETAAVLAAWLAAAVLVPQFWFAIYLPGYALGLGLCYLQGHFEHSPQTASYYGKLYNVCFFNDGYHVEHHAAPSAHWTEVARNGACERSSRFPPVLRWLERCNLDTLERCALRSRRIRSWLLQTHGRAISALAPRVGAVRTVAVVGGALFPRTATVCRALFPDARIVVVDASLEHITTARALLSDSAIEFRHAVFTPGSDAVFGAVCADDPGADSGRAARHAARLAAPHGADRIPDLVVIPLALRGERAAVYAAPPGRWCIVHDWIWNRRGVASAVVSPLLLKRVNLLAGQ